MNILSVRRGRIALFVVLGALVAHLAYGATFNLFSPASGVLKGNPSTYVTTSAASADIIGLFSGTCSAATFLRGDGSCASTGGGTVSSVALTAPSVFSVAGSPVTSTGTLALSFATGQTQNQVLASPDGTSGALSLRALVGADIPAINVAASGNGGITGDLPYTNLAQGSALSVLGVTGNATADVASIAAGSDGQVLRRSGTALTFGAIALASSNAVSGILPGANGGTNNGFMDFTGPTTSLKTFTLPNASSTILTTNAAVTVAQGGTGAATLSGVLKGNGTSAIGSAASSDVIALWSGTCNSSTFLRADGSCQTAGGGTPGGSDTQLQYNNAGAFGGTSQITFNNATGALTSTASITGTALIPTGSSVPANGMYLSAANTVSLSNATSKTITLMGGSAASGTLNIFGGTAKEADLLLSPNGTLAGVVGSAGATNDIATGSAAGDLVLRTQGGNVRVSVNSGTTSISITPGDNTSTPSATGCTTTPSSTVKVHRIGTVVVGYMSGVSCTSNATTFTFPSAVPAGYIPTTNGSITTRCQDSGNDVPCMLTVQNNGTISFAPITNGAFASSGTKSLAANTFFSYITDN